MGNSIDPEKLEDSVLEDTRRVEKFYLSAGVPEEELGLLFLRHSIYLLYKSAYYDELDSETIFEGLASKLTDEVHNAIKQVDELKEGAEEDRKL